MKKFIASVIALFIITLPVLAQTSTITIKVKDNDNLSLPGASVLLTPGNYGGVTNQSGEIVLAGIKPANYKLVITYIGYTPLSKDIEVSQGNTQIAETLTGSYITSNGVMVLGDRLKGQARALNQQKNSDNITNIISADQMGRFPDANIGDAIKRVPGITMQNDQGEARNIVVRGMGPEFNSVTFNGERIPSAEGDNRRVQLDLIPSDMIQTVEVNKTLTADMDADAIGGSVNLVSRSAPNGLRVSGTLAGGYNPIRDNGFMGTANVVVGNRFAHNKLGFVFSGSYNRNKFGSDNVEAVWSKDENGKTFVSDHDLRVYDELRIRRSASLSLDYKISPVHTITLNGNYNWRDDKENRFRLRHRYKGDPEDYADDLQYDAAGNITGYSNGEVLRQTKGGLDNGRNANRRLEDQRVRNLALRGDHLFGRIRTNWSIQYAKASEKRPHERYIALGQEDIDVTQDISNTRFPILYDNTSLNDYTNLDELTEQFQDQFERDVNAKLNFEVPLSLVYGQPGFLKFGARLRNKKKERNNNFFEYEPINEIDNITSLPLINRSSTSFYAGKKYIAGQFINPRYLGNLDFTNPALYEQEDKPDEYLAGNFKAKETISAGYLSLNQDFTEKLSANIGVRVEHTSLDYTGNIIEDEELLKGQANLKNNYTDVLPNINLKYKLSGSFVIKAAWTNTLARPKYYDLVPYFNIKPSDNEISVGNPTLEPVKSTNLDLMTEKYFKSVGLISGGVFYKKLDKFFYTYIDPAYTRDEFAAAYPGIENPIGDDDTYEFTQRRNGDGATVYGLEVALQRQLDFLPGIWKGLGIYLNYTYTHSKTTGIFDPETGELIRSNVKLPGAAPHIFNASVSFENKKFNVRVSGNYTSSYVDDSDDAGYNSDSFSDRYYSKQFFLDANASYAFTTRWRVFGEANNLTNQPLRYYQGSKDRTAQLEYYGPRFNLGVKFDLSK
ncbi:MAG: TonB-dependent receptor [Chitinophagaceae bacterium]